MRLYQRPPYEVWWLDTMTNGERYRVSLDTTDKREAKRRAKQKIAEIEEGKLSAKVGSFARMMFGDAADDYLAKRKPELAASTYARETECLKPLREYFKKERLNKINADMLLNYRTWRVENGIGNATINREIGVLRRMLVKAKRWHIISDDIKPLKEPSSIGRAMTPEQKQKLLEVAAQRPEWQTAYFAAILVLNTTMRSCEVKSLLWSDIDFFERTLTIRKSKTVAGERTIPLTREAFDVLIAMQQRAELFGRVEQHHFIFATYRPTAKFNNTTVTERQMTGYDPTQPIGSWKKAWRTLTKQAGLKGLRFHDLRHHAITELAESGASEQTIMAIAGHVSQRMLQRYSHIRLQAKRAAIEVLSGTHNQSVRANGTVNGTVAENLPVYSDLSPLESKDDGMGITGLEPVTPAV